MMPKMAPSDKVFEARKWLVQCIMDMSSKLGLQPVQIARVLDKELDKQLSLVEMDCGLDS